jgi:hypothetical protein
MRALFESESSALPHHVDRCHQEDNTHCSVYREIGVFGFRLIFYLWPI